MVRRVPRRLRQPLDAPAVLNQTWALDFVSDTRYDRRRARALTILDEGNREGLDIAVGISLPSRRVVRVLEDLVTVHGRPVAGRVDNGPAFLAQSFVDGAAAHRIAIHLSNSMPCGNTNLPAPQLRRSLPDESNCRIGSTVKSAQELTPQRSNTQMLPFPSTLMAFVDPIFRPSGIVTMSATVR